MTSTLPKMIIAGSVIFVFWTILTYPTCTRYEQQWVHRDAWVQFVPTTIGDITTITPIFYPETNGYETVCVERKSR